LPGSDKQFFLDLSDVIARDPGKCHTGHASAPTGGFLASEWHLAQGPRPLNEPRKHHYVPIFYQKHFTNADGLLWVYDRKCKTYKELSPEVICCQKDLYALKPDDGPRDQRVESLAMAAADGQFATALREIISGRPERPDRAVFELIAFFAGVQSTRLPSTARFISGIYKAGVEEMARLMSVSVDRMKSTLDRYSRETGEVIDVSPESMVDAIRGNRLKLTVTEVPFLNHIFQDAKSRSDLYLTCNWEFLLASAETGFVVCDDPVTVVPPKGIRDVGIGIPGTAKYFPLGRRVCLRMGDMGNKLRFRYRNVERQLVRIINQNIAVNSERFIMSPIRAQLENVIARSATEGMEAIPRFTLETTNQDDNGSLQRITQNARRYFYLQNASQAP
jgi:hypothetical protein